MGDHVIIELEVPRELRKLKFPKALDKRLQQLLDRQSESGKLTAAEREEAEGLVNLAEMLSFLRLRAERVRKKS